MRYRTPLYSRFYVAVYEIIRVAVVPLALRYYFLKIKLSGFREQRVKFLRYILLCSEMVQMLLPFKEREDFWCCLFIPITCLWCYGLTICFMVKNPCLRS